jgi:hypothetical protein
VLGNVSGELEQIQNEEGAAQSQRTAQRQCQARGHLRAPRALARFRKVINLKLTKLTGSIGSKGRWR